MAAQGLWRENILRRLIHADDAIHSCRLKCINVCNSKSFQMWVCSTNVNRHKTILHPNRNKQWSQAFLISVSHVFHVHRVVYTYPRVFVPRFTPSPCTCTPGFRTIWCQLHGATCLRKLGHMIKKIISVFNRGMTSYPLYLEEKKSLFFGSDTGSQICQFSGCT